MPRRYRKRKRSFRKRRRARGMQRIRTYRYRSRNLGGDRAKAKLYYQAVQNMGLAIGQSSSQLVWCPNVGATPDSMFNGIARRFGATPGLAVLANQFLRYRIRGVKLRYTIIPVKVDPATHSPVNFYVNAQASGVPITENAVGPTPPFPALQGNITPEQRWSRWAPVRFPMAGASPTVVKAYYSVNKVFGQDSIVKNDESFVGQLKTTPSYWDTASFAHPVQGIWIQHGVATMNGEAAEVAQTYVIQTQATFYAEFFGKRTAIE